MVCRHQAAADDVTPSDDVPVLRYDLCVKRLASDVWLIALSRVTSMNQALRNYRIAELRTLQSCNPRELIDRYCQITGELSGAQLPHVSFSRMIEVIVDHEADSEKSPDATD